MCVITDQFNKLLLFAEFLYIEGVWTWSCSEELGSDWPILPHVACLLHISQENLIKAELYKLFDYMIP